MYYKIFNALTGNYIKAWHEYNVYREGAIYQYKYFLISNSYNRVETVPENSGNLHDTAWLAHTYTAHVKQDIKFRTYQRLLNFLMTWFNESGFTGIYIEGQFNDNLAYYANGDEQYPLLAYEIHGFDDDNKIVEHCSLDNFVVRTKK